MMHPGGKKQSILLQMLNQSHSKVELIGLRPSLKSGELVTKVGWCLALRLNSSECRKHHVSRAAKRL